MVLPRQDTGRKISRLTKGNWDRFEHLPGKRTAAIACPMCDHLFSVVNHQITADGSCSPSVVCPHRDCTFHQFVQLLGWET